jgi:prepilin-type N-terminal cleavage/methylation domain-containing protein
MKAKTHLFQNKSRGGFTLVEMLVVIGMIATLAGISFPVYKSIQNKVEKQKVQMLFTSVERAVDNFQTEYNYLPYPTSWGNYPNTTAGFSSTSDGDWVDSRQGEMTEMVTILAGLGNNINFKQIKFLESEDMVISGNTATLYDPWGFEYFGMRVDYNLDGLLSRPFDASSVYYQIKGKRAAIYSYGPDNLGGGGSGWQTQERNLDNVYSWIDPPSP